MAEATLDFKYLIIWQLLNLRIGKMEKFQSNLWEEVF